ncbi:DUF6339 family protein [Arthrobacter sp. CAN_C5]|uniref:DUF6339 family protein n=1 Tax=Arthrobacter sp. CAN_C5 TaxID=2760706 RepID=UPI001AE7F067|nr:DUF6339 family protein [Arthrobacter sp. CAN_C5]MBP2218023.1 hypothetical protein [Arthrobacter sp. CAN_C5]
MTENAAHALTFEALVLLTRALETSNSPEDFLAAADAIIAQPDNVLPLPFDTGRPEPLSPSAGKTSKDVDTAPQVYEYLGALDRSNASDRRLWTYLAFSTFRSYMEERWPLAGARNWKGRVRDRWLLLNVSRSPLVRHGIARLWWVTSLTYDPLHEYALSKESGDPFAYTREIFRNEDRLNSLFERESGALPNLVRAVLEHVARGGANSTDDHLRAIMTEVTLVYGYRDLGLLDIDDLRTLVAQAAPVLASA